MHWENRRFPHTLRGVKLATGKTQKDQLWLNLGKAHPLIKGNILHLWRKWDFCPISYLLFTHAVVGTDAGWWY